MIKLFCCSDTHGLPPPLPRVPVDACLHAGDFYNKGTRKYRTLFGPKAVALSEWAERHPSFYSVYGNHDGNDEVGFFSRFSKNINGSTARIADDVLLVGIGWHGNFYYDLPSEKGLEISCASAMDSLRRNAKENDKFIVLSHYPAYTPAVFGLEGKKPEGWMFDCVREVVDEIKPMVVVAGHIHELFGQQAVYKGPTHSCLLAFPGNFGGVVTCDLEKMFARFDPQLG